MTKDVRGIILKGVGGLYGVRPDRIEETDIGDTILCSARGLFRHENITPLPGDEVLLRYSGIGEDAYVIQEILPGEIASSVLPLQTCRICLW